MRDYTGITTISGQMRRPSFVNSTQSTKGGSGFYTAPRIVVPNSSWGPGEVEHHFIVLSRILLAWSCCLLLP